MKMKTYSFKPITCEMGNNFPKGLILKRDVTTHEARYIMIRCFGIAINTIEDCYDEEEYREYNANLTTCVNKWLKGDVDDSAIMDYAYDYSNEQLGLFNLLIVLTYLERRDII